MKTQKHKGVFFSFFFFKMTRCNPRGGKNKKNKPKKEKKKKRKKWHCQNGRTGRRSEATNRLIWSVTLHAEVHEEKGAPSKMPPLSIWMNAGKTEEARSSRCLSRQNKRSLWKRYHPVWGTALVERVTFASAWISWVVHFILFHTCTHSQFRDAQFVFSKFEATRGRRRLDLRRGIHRKLHRVKNAPAVTGVKLKVSPGFQ